jgi:MFS family permease
VYRRRWRRPIGGFAEGSVTEQRRSLWHHPDFLKLWTAETVSQVGTQVTQLALPLVAIVILEATPFEVALLGMVEFLPFILLSLPAGVWVDRLRRRPILVAGDLGRAALLASVPIAYLAGVLTIWQLYAVGFSVGCLTVFFDVAYQSYLPSIVERDDLVEGNSKLEISRSGAAFVGPPLAGILVEWLKAPVAIAVDAISYVGSAFFVLLIRRHEPEVVHPDVAAGGERPSMRQDVTEGLRYVLGHRYLRWIAASTGTSNLFSSISGAILLVYAVRELDLSAGVIGTVFAIGNVGFFVGAFVASRIAARIGVGPAIIVADLIGAIGGVLVPLASRGVAIPAIALAGVLIGFGSVVYNINQVSFRQAITPERMQGRMNATMRFIVWGTMPVGALIGGALGSTIGLLPTLWIAAIGGFLPLLFLTLTPVRTIRTIPSSPEAYADREDARRAAAGAGGVGPVEWMEASIEVEERAEAERRAEEE